MKHRLTCLFIVLFVATSYKAPKTNISVLDLRLVENRQASNGHLGAEVRCRLGFSWLEKHTAARRFFISWSLEDEAGNEVYNHVENHKTLDHKRSVYAMEDTLEGSAFHMTIPKLKLFIPYNLVRGQRGPRKLQLVLSAHNKTHSFPRFLDVPIEIQLPKHEIFDFNHQEFSLSETTVFQGHDLMDSLDKGIDINAELSIKHGISHVKTDKYLLYWSWATADGKVVFNSENASSTFHDKEYIGLNSFRIRRKKVGRKKYVNHYHRKFHCFTAFKDIPLSGAHEMTFILRAAEAFGEEPIIVLEQKHMISFPERYSYANQSFKIDNIKVLPGEKDGLTGLDISFNCSVKFPGIPKETDFDNAYFFFVELFDEEHKPIFKPRQKIKGEHSSTDHYKMLEPSTASSYPIQVFIPYIQLPVSSGNHQLSLRLNATDLRNRVLFQNIAGTNFKIDQPNMNWATIRVDSLRAKPGEYDLQINILGSKQLQLGDEKPEIQWAIRVGRDFVFRSKEGRNSLRGIPGSCKIAFTQKAPLWLEVYDADNDGLLTSHNLMGKYRLPVYTSGEMNKKISKLSFGHIERLNLEISTGGN